MVVDIVGKGKVGNHLYDALSSIEGIRVSLIDSRTLEGLQKEAEVILLTVSDIAISEVAGKLADYSGVIAHVSGSTPLETLGRTERGGVFYPLQSFSSGVPVDFSEVPFFIEGTDESSKKILMDLACKLSPKVIEANGEMRGAFHLAGVFACNFVNEMMAVGFNILQQSNLSAELLYPLVRLTVEKALESGPENVRTGPAARHDFSILAKQESALSSYPLLLDIYKAITKLILNKTSKE